GVKIPVRLREIPSRLREMRSRLREIPSRLREVPSRLREMSSDFDVSSASLRWRASRRCQKQARTAPVSRSEPNLFRTLSPSRSPDNDEESYPKRFSTNPPSRRKPGAVLLQRRSASTRTL